MSKTCINCIHKDVCYLYRLNYISAREGYCNNYYEEPKNGNWIKKVDDVGFVSFICSNCGFELELEDCFDSYYCTRCGRKMTEEDKK